MRILNYILGPRVTITELSDRWPRYIAPAVCLSLARVCLLVSLFFPYWHIKLKAPQYPRRDLQIDTYVNRVEGDMREINLLNHYIGMRPLDEAAPLEKEYGVWAVIGLIMLMEAAMYIHSRWALVLLLPAILFPLAFLADLYYWLNLFGQNLDPKAPLSNAIKPFSPPALGEGIIGQFKTIAWTGAGLWLAWAAAGLMVIGLLLHRRAYKPLYDSMKKRIANTEAVASHA